MALPFRTIADILPDRSGVLAIFSHGEYVDPDGTDVFPAPNNAAVFNADGFLRFQVRIPRGREGFRIGGLYGAAGALPGKFSDYLSVVVAVAADAPPEWGYAVDPNNPELIETGQWTRW